MKFIYLFILQCGLFCFPLPHEARRLVSLSAAPQIPPRVFRRTPSQVSTVEYTLITLNSPDCELYPIDRFPVRVQYRDTRSGGWTNLDSTIASTQVPVPGPNDCESFTLTPSDGNEGIGANVRSYSAVLPNVTMIDGGHRIQLRLVQSDHRGGFCDCWAVSNLALKLESSKFHKVLLNQTQICGVSGEIYDSLRDFLQHSGTNDDAVTCTTYTISADTSVLGFCRGSASVPRGFVSVELGAYTQSECENTAAVVDTGRAAPLVGEQCDSLPHVEINFSLEIMPDDLDSLDEGVEFGYRKNGDEWIPLAFFSSRSDQNDDIKVGELMPGGNLTIRRYSVQFFHGDSHCVQLKLCGSEIIQDNVSLSFRWLQTVKSTLNLTVDDIFLDDVQISIYSHPLRRVLLMDDFDSDNQISSNRWTNIRRVTLDEQNHRLLFGEARPTFGPLPPSANRTRQTIISRAISTVPLQLNFQIQISYTLLTASSPDCLNTGLFTASPPLLQFRVNDSLTWAIIEAESNNVPLNEQQNVVVRSYSASVNDISLSALPVQFRFVQLDHRGGFCDCWAVTNLTVAPTNGQAIESSEICGGNASKAFQSLLEQLMSNQMLGDSAIAGLCGDNASIPRVFVAQYGGTSLQKCNDSLMLEPGILPTEVEATDMTVTNDNITMNPLESAVQDSIRENGNFGPVLIQIEEKLHTVALTTLNDLVNPSINIASNMNLTQAVYLLSAIVAGFGSQTVGPEVSQLVLSVASQLLEIAQNRVKNGASTSEDLAGSTLLQIIDRFALNNHNISHPVMSDNIVFEVEEVSLNDIEDDTLSGVEAAEAEILIPREVLEGSEGPVRMASLLFRNKSGLLPERLEGNDNDSDSDDLVFRLASPVISASFQCDTCTTSNLSTPVQVTFKHTPYDQALVDNDNESLVMCVFWDFDDNIEQQPRALLFLGQWSEEGCETNFNSTMTVCKCNHLTHFAILLSARPLNLSPQKTLALQITGYIGVSISLVAMAITVIVFLFLKPLRTMRNYIHIQLCVTLGIAQIIFVAGIEPHLGEGHLVGGVPVGCRLVAVLLHYWFLVSFMWMLMEGVVLYVALVRVFISHHARYIAVFTIASYGLPLLYLGGLTVPLGFARSEEMRRNQTYDYGYQQACYLNPATSFIWSFIAPVILILLANIGFFIMAAFIMNRHQRRQHNKSTVQRVRHWLKVSISLTVVMGITWIIGVLVIEVEELFALAFIFTIFVAFQGLFIFVIFVLLSKQVRENYSKWWKAKVAESDFLSSYFGEKHPTLGTYASSTVQSQPLPLHEKNNKQWTSFEDSNKVNVKNSQNNNELKPPDVQDSNDKTMYSFNVTYVPASSVTMDTEVFINQHNVLSIDKEF